MSSRLSRASRPRQRTATHAARPGHLPGRAGAACLRRLTASSMIIAIRSFVGSAAPRSDGRDRGSDGIGTFGLRDALTAFGHLFMRCSPWTVMPTWPPPVGRYLNKGSENCRRLASAIP